MLSALLILMIGFVGGVIVTVALGVGLYRLAGADEQEVEPEPTEMAPRRPPSAGPSPYAPGYKGFSQTQRSSAINQKDWY